MTRAFLVLSAIMLLPWCQTAAAEPVRESERMGLQRLSQALKQGDVEACVVGYFPVEIETFVGIDPDRAMKHPMYRITVSDFMSSRLESSLSESLDTTRLSAQKPGGGDYRWTCVFYDVSGKKIVSIAMAGWGDAVVIDGNRLAMSGGLVTWIKRSFRPAFQYLFDGSFKPKIYTH